ncbi:hypothetical protein PT974_07578 [Cladobotryum mycophilum]|uniref:Uncharacterized protein n=1 Tax=Cladobotryum mycophilum TaxID=491253 RepID=A0ABR0SPM4_9HYPO
MTDLGNTELDHGILSADEPPTPVRIRNCRMFNTPSPMLIPSEVTQKKCRCLDGTTADVVKIAYLGNRTPVLSIFMLDHDIPLVHE